MKAIAEFQPDRLRDALSLRQRTARDVAAAVKINANSLSRYLTGASRPRAHVLLALARELNLPETFFLTPAPEMRGSPIFFRSLAAATKRARSRAEVQHRWLREAWDHVQQYVEFPDVDFPIFSLPTDPVEIGPESIEGVAREARRYWNLGTGPIANIVKLLESKGGICARVNLTAPKLDAFSQWAVPENRPFVTLNADKRAAVRSRWDAAHELGHMLLHRHVVPSLLMRPEVFKYAERQAHYFAGAFLLPAESFGRSIYVPTISALLMQKRTWGVSVGGMLRRLTNLGLISADQAKRVWQSYSRQGMRLREPLDDELSPEQPEVMRVACETVMSERRITKDQLLAPLPHDKSELCALMSLMVSRNDAVIRLRPAPSEEHDPGIRLVK